MDAFQYRAEKMAELTTRCRKVHFENLQEKLYERILSAAKWGKEYLYIDYDHYYPEHLEQLKKDGYKLFDFGDGYRISW